MNNSFRLTHLNSNQYCVANCLICNGFPIFWLSAFVIKCGKKYYHNNDMMEDSLIIASLVDDRNYFILNLTTKKDKILWIRKVNK